MKNNLSPIDTRILNIVKTVLKEKCTLVKIGKTRFDQQFINLVSLNGLSNLLSDEIDYLEKQGYITSIEKDDRYMGNTTHYILTEKGKLHDS